jgi:hypothetical protein
MKEEICKTLDQANLFEQQGYYKTASQIVSLAKAVDQKEISSTGKIVEKILAIKEIFGNEFAEADQIGSEYRRRCFLETSNVIFGAFLAINSQNLLTPPELTSFLGNVTKQDDFIISADKSLAALLHKPDRFLEENRDMFCYACIIYEHSISGKYASAVKLLFRLMSFTGFEVPEIEQVNDIWAIYRSFKKAHIEMPTFLEGWPEKNSIKNAIANAQNKYDPILDQAHFVSQNPKTGEITYDKKMSFADFFAIWKQVADAIDSVRYSISLFGIMDSLCIASFV